MVRLTWSRTMTIFCDCCSRPLRKEMNRPWGRTRLVPNTSKPFRSTKGASKARRDLINAELQTLRSLLPLSAQEKERLSYLHTMALVCLQIRGSQLFPPGPCTPAGPAITNAVMPDLDLLSLLPGFILALSADGKLAYISENITQILGFSVVELLAQGDSIFDLLDNRAHETVQKKLHAAQEQPGTEIAFVSEMRTSRSFRMKYGGNRAVAVRGRFLALNRVPTSSILTFIAFCTPITQFLEDGHDASNDVPFYSQHTLNMRMSDVTESVVYHLGYRREELIGQSWYTLVHPEDIGVAAALHETLVCDPGSCHQHLMVRMLCKDLSWAWMGITASREHGREIITCINVSLSEEEAQYLQGLKPGHGAGPTAAPCPRPSGRQREQGPLPRPAPAPGGALLPSLPAAAHRSLYEALPSSAAPAPVPGLAVGSPPPPWALSALAGHIQALADSLARYSQLLQPRVTPDPEPWWDCNSAETTLSALLQPAPPDSHWGTAVTHPI
ncbi:neuronal PAS domain-containing protein 4-like [Alligator sinensis]|uniref:Neuronal PAS domain-containing protein 4-like n=1 Tax=Alligator sinensis TaxID=38654 RepID=A0A3Q0H6L9_ALLSI|nr:neuronal PAS domain-containing protein 4-like [Alligator sinensis]